MGEAAEDVSEFDLEARRLTHASVALDAAHDALGRVWPRAHDRQREWRAH